MMADKRNWDLHVFAFCFSQACNSYFLAKEIFFSIKEIQAELLREKVPNFLLKSKKRIQEILKPFLISWI